MQSIYDKLTGPQRREIMQKLEDELKNLPADLFGDIPDDQLVGQVVDAVGLTL